MKKSKNGKKNKKRLVSFRLEKFLFEDVSQKLSPLIEHLMVIDENLNDLIPFLYLFAENSIKFSRFRSN